MLWLVLQRWAVPRGMRSCSAKFSHNCLASLYYRVNFAHLVLQVLSPVKEQVRVTLGAYCKMQQMPWVVPQRWAVALGASETSLHHAQALLPVQSQQLPSQLQCYKALEAVAVRQGGAV